MRENIGRQVSLPSLSLDTNPGRTSISMPTCEESSIYDTRFGKIKSDLRLIELVLSALLSGCYHQRRRPSNRLPRIPAYSHRKIG